MSDAFSLALPPETLERLAERVAAILVEQGRREYLDAEEASAYLRLAPGRLHKLTSNGRIPCRREGRRLLFVRNELDEWLDSGEAALD